MVTRMIHLNFDVNWTRTYGISVHIYGNTDYVSRAMACCVVITRCQSMCTWSTATAGTGLVSSYHVAIGLQNLMIVWRCQETTMTRMHPIITQSSITERLQTTWVECCWRRRVSPLSWSLSLCRVSSTCRQTRDGRCWHSAVLSCFSSPAPTSSTATTGSGSCMSSWNRTRYMRI